MQASRQSRIPRPVVPPGLRRAQLSNNGVQRKKKWTADNWRRSNEQKENKANANWKKSKMLIALTLVWKKSGVCRSSFQSIKSPGDRFRYVAKMILACVVWSKGRRSRMEFDYNQSLLSFMQTGTRPKNLMFDASLYKANRERVIHSEVRRILSLPPAKKTERDIQLALIALREIPSFAEYPTPMQRLMCRLGWYQNVGPKRVIIREGQRAYNFYFILSGTVVITEWSPVTKSSQTKCMLQRGMEFGEQAVFKQTYRSATVLSHTATELLCIDAAILASIYMCGRDKPIIDMEVISFLSAVDFLKGFPLEMLHDNPQAIMFHYFQKGQVLVRNSHFSDWIYIVKSGSIKVLKKLESASPHMQHDRNGHQDRHLTTMRDLHKTRTSYIERMKRLKSIGQHKNSTGTDTTKHAKRLSREYENIVQYTRAALHPITEDVDGEETEALYADNQRLTTPRPHFHRTSQGELSRYPSQNNMSAYGSPLARNLPPLVEGKLPIVAQLEAASRQNELQCNPSGITDDNIENPTFIVLRILEKGQTFGVTSTIFENQPSLSIVSNGADCLLLSKQFFIKHCSDKMLTQLKEQKLPYPSNEELQIKLLEYIEWMKYKNQQYKMAVKAHSK